MLIDTNKANESGWRAYLDKVLAVNLQEYRKQAGLTQQDVATALNISKATISRYESASRVPDDKQLSKIAKLFGCSKKCLLGWETKDSARILQVVKSHDCRELENILGLESGSIIATGVDTVHLTEHASARSRLLLNFDQLNEKGQQTAAERVEELTKIDDYRKNKE